MNQHATPALGRARYAVAVFCALLLAHHAAQASAVMERLGLVDVFMVSNSDSGKCLSKSGGANLGQQFHGWRCNTKSPLQKFTLLERERGLYLIRTETGQLCLDVSGSAIKKRRTGGAVGLHRCGQPVVGNHPGRWFQAFPAARTSFRALPQSRQGGRKSFHLRAARLRARQQVANLRNREVAGPRAAGAQPINAFA